MPELQKVRYKHEAMIDMIVANPALKQGEIAAAFGMSQGWVSQIFSSDSFQAKLATRKKELVEATVLNSVEEGFTAIARRSTQVVLDKLEANPSSDFALEALKASSKALGYGARPANGGQTNVQNNVVVVVPPKANTSDDWAKAYAQAAKTGQANEPEIVDAKVLSATPAQIPRRALPSEPALVAELLPDSRN